MRDLDDVRNGSGAVDNVAISIFNILREGDTLVVRRVDRPGRFYQDVTDTTREFINRGVTIRTVTTSIVRRDPTQQAIRDALTDFMAAMARQGR